MRIVTLIIALLLLAGSIDPTRNSFIVLAVFSGLAFVHWRPWRLLDAEPVADLRVVPFVLALLLLAGVIDPSRGVFIGLTVAAGLALVTPRIVGFGRLDTPRWSRPYGYFARHHEGHWHREWKDWS